jgi:hypothetical protein
VRWNGSEWKSMQSVSGEINKVSCASATSCVAVGVSNTGVAQSWLIYEYLGGWVVSPNAPALPAGATETVLKGVSCTATACTAVGSYKSGSTYKPLVERWNGSSWSLQTAPGPAEGSAQNAMLAVSCASFRVANTCLAVGEAAGKPVAEIWNGSEWSRTSAAALPDGASGAKFVGVSCGSPNSCMAVGNSYEAAAGSEKALIERWNGGEWSILTSPTPAEAKGFINLYDISCLSPSSCFAVGTFASSVTGGNPLATRTLAETWENGAWTLQSSPNAIGQAYNALLGVSCTSSIACNALGGSSATQIGPSTLLAGRYE